MQTTTNKLSTLATLWMEGYLTDADYTECIVNPSGYYSRMILGLQNDWELCLVAAQLNSSTSVVR